MDVLIISIIFSALIGGWANSWGRSGLGWCGLALLISPLITAIILIFCGRYIETKETQ